MRAVLQFSDAVRQQLRDAMLDERDLADLLRHAQPEPDPSRPGYARCGGLVPVRRTLDLETSQLRRVELLLRSVADGWEVEAVSGLGS